MIVFKKYYKLYLYKIKISFFMNNNMIDLNNKNLIHFF